LASYGQQGEGIRQKDLPVEKVELSMTAKQYERPLAELTSWRTRAEKGRSVGGKKLPEKEKK